MTSPEPTASVEAFSVLAMAITPFLSGAHTVRRALKCSEAPNACNKIRCSQRRGRGGGPIRRRSARRRAARLVRPAERRLHLAAHLHGERVFVVVDVAPAQALALRDTALEPDLMGEPERQQPLGERARGRDLLAPHAKAALAVEYLALLERALGGSGDVGAEARRRAGRLLAQSDARHRHAELEPDHVNGPVQRGVASALVRQHRVFLETAPRVVALALEHHVGAEREMMRHVAAVAIDRRGHFGDAGLLERAAGHFGLAY